MLWNLFITFFKIGLMSFGGGYAMLPVIQHEVNQHGWLSDQAFADTVALAGMAPGPIATNSATLIGFKTAGASGAFAATAGMVLPSLLIVVVIATFFLKYHRHERVKAAFYGLRPVVTGLIAYAALRYGLASTEESGIWNWSLLGGLIITACVVVGMIRYKMHPAAALVLSGLLGIAFFS
ncbi:chromate transporter [Paenibacillus sp. UNCCL117]|uniref:chromate transporter n=1 Tax=unclassified Paenibacillus TaxID=185978 RepID=UPI00088839CA|nr:MULTISPECIES: chromate transporter [unclassified Paenibacillus]SDE14459.1 chromate transporter [Paenibacillus sp. cl123]SFW60604.1 chromate transporter [Paenibacillus sp. UNCCL117]